VNWDAAGLAMRRAEVNVARRLVVGGGSGDGRTAGRPLGRAPAAFPVSSVDPHYLVLVMTKPTVGDPNDPIFSLSIDDGAGAILAAAAGDVAGGADSTSYSAITQSSTVLAYHLLTHGEVDREVLARGYLELAGGEDGRYTYRAPTAAFDEWLKSSLKGNPTVSAMPSSEPAARGVPIGLFHRRNPDALIASAVQASRVTHLDAATAVVATAVAGAVAGSCFVQAGADLVFGASETADRAVETIGEEPYRFGDVAAAPAAARRLRSLATMVRADPAEIVEAVCQGAGAQGIDGALLGIVLGANASLEPVKAIEAAAVHGGTEAGVVAGAIVGARVGLIRWPWRVHNDTWFAEIGRRLVTRHAEVRDLPIPYAVEERMLMASRTKASEETI
jgi:ADP-ribosylglycohydrolase